MVKLTSKISKVCCAIILAWGSSHVKAALSTPVNRNNLRNMATQRNFMPPLHKLPTWLQKIVNTNIGSALSIPANRNTPLPLKPLPWLQKIVNPNMGSTLSIPANRNMPLPLKPLPWLLPANRTMPLPLKPLPWLLPANRTMPPLRKLPSWLQKIVNPNMGSTLSIPANRNMPLPLKPLPWLQKLTLGRNLGQSTSRNIPPVPLKGKENVTPVPSTSHLPSQDVAIACVTDLHCNDSQYPKIVRAVNDLCQQYSTVIVCINGDFVTRILRQSSVPHWRVIRSSEDASGTHRDRLEECGRFCDNLLANDMVQLVFNLGNHEFMHPEEVTDWLKVRVSRGRTHVVSNIDPGNGPLSGLVKRSVVIAGVTIAGYCTNEIYKDPHCQFARDRGYLTGNWRTHNARFEECIRAVNTSALVVLSHETRNKSGKYVCPIVSRCCPPSVVLKIIEVGHDHFDFREEDSPRQFGDYPGNAVQNLESNSYFRDADRVFCIPPFGCGIGILYLHSGGKYECETKLLSPIMAKPPRSNKLIRPRFEPIMPRGPIPISVY
ncbi:MAG: metallophosphoesterase [Puniceicoccales bacterium]|jgi:hypothetical protein|nr:metallophosphoesterase [Puniceicoccales bacterium]